MSSANSLSRGQQNSSPSLMRVEPCDVTLVKTSQTPAFLTEAISECIDDEDGDDDVCLPEQINQELLLITHEPLLEDEPGPSYRKLVHGHAFPKIISPLDLPQYWAEKRLDDESAESTEKKMSHTNHIPVQSSDNLYDCTERLFADSVKSLENLDNVCTLEDSDKTGQCSAEGSGEVRLNQAEGIPERESELKVQPHSGKHSHYKSTRHPWDPKLDRGLGLTPRRSPGVNISRQETQKKLRGCLQKRRMKISKLSDWKKDMAEADTTCQKVSFATVDEVRIFSNNPQLKVCQSYVASSMATTKLRTLTEAEERAREMEVTRNMNLKAAKFPPPPSARTTEIRAQKAPEVLKGRLSCVDFDIAKLGSGNAPQDVRLIRQIERNTDTNSLLLERERNKRQSVHVSAQLVETGIHDLPESYHLTEESLQPEQENVHEIEVSSQTVASVGVSTHRTQESGYPMEEELIVISAEEPSQCVHELYVKQESRDAWQEKQSPTEDDDQTLEKSLQSSEENYTPKQELQVRQPQPLVKRLKTSEENSHSVQIPFSIHTKGEFLQKDQSSNVCYKSAWETEIQTSERTDPKEHVSQAVCEARQSSAAEDNDVSRKSSFSVNKVAPDCPDRVSGVESKTSSTAVNSSEVWERNGAASSTTKDGETTPPTVFPRSSEHPRKLRRLFSEVAHRLNLCCRTGGHCDPCKLCEC